MCPFLQNISGYKLAGACVGQETRATFYETCWTYKQTIRYVDYWLNLIIHEHIQNKDKSNKHTHTHT